MLPYLHQIFSHVNIYSILIDLFLTSSANCPTSMCSTDWIRTNHRSTGSFPTILGHFEYMIFHWAVFITRTRQFLNVSCTLVWLLFGRTLVHIKDQQQGMLQFVYPINDDGHLMASKHMHMVLIRHAFGARLVCHPLCCVVLLTSNMPRCHAKAKLVGSTFRKHIQKLLLLWTVAAAATTISYQAIRTRGTLFPS